MMHAKRKRKKRDGDVQKGDMRLLGWGSGLNVFGGTDYKEPIEKGSRMPVGFWGNQDSATLGEG